MRALFFSILAFLFGIVAATGCNVDQILESIPENPSAAVNASSGGLTPRADSEATLKIASFNIQVLGQSKLEKPEVMQVLTRIVRRFSIVAIQELRSKEQDVIPQWLEMINSDGSNYGALVGPRLGRTTSKEQYVFLYDRNLVQAVPHSDYTINDPLDLLHREPLVATFHAAASGQRPFSFTLINIHTDPDETDEEVDALAEVFEVVRQANPGEDDVILLGDLNVDYEELGLLAQIPNIQWTVQGTPTNTRKTASYDNILFDRTRTTEFSGEAGVLDFAAEYQLTEDQALDVSDHLPVWAVFSAYEQAPLSVAAAARPSDR